MSRRDEEWGMIGERVSKFWLVVLEGWRKVHKYLTNAVGTQPARLYLD